MTGAAERFPAGGTADRWLAIGRALMRQPPACLIAGRAIASGLDPLIARPEFFFDAIRTLKTGPPGTASPWLIVRGKETPTRAARLAHSGYRPRVNGLITLSGQRHGNCLPQAPPKNPPFAYLEGGTGGQ